MPQSQQAFEFIESINDALGAAVRALGGPKAVGAMLKPEKTIHDAAGWVTDCLNPDRAAEFHPAHVMFILREAKRVGFHGAMNYVCTDAEYGNPAPVEPEDEKAQLMREFIEATRQQTKNVERLAQLGATGIRAVA